ncbi:MAG: hypothetical protein SNJ63_04325 [Sphingomonadaceae bacterium]
MIPDCPWMVFLPYTPRSDSVERGYEQWLIEVDNPFFNAIAPIAHYGNWAVAQVLAGDPGFTHFDFMRFASEDDIARAWNDPDLLAFASGWVDQWGVEPDSPDPSVNYHAYVARRISGAPGPDEGNLYLALEPEATTTSDELWEISRPIVGTPICHRFAIRRGTSPSAPIMVAGRLIAAP